MSCINQIHQVLWKISINGNIAIVYKERVRKSTVYPLHIFLEGSWEARKNDTIELN